MISRNALPLIYVCGLISIGGLLAPSASGQVSGWLGGFMQLSNLADGGSFIFGAGQTVAIDGAIPFIPYCQYGGKTEGPLLFYPTADFYVIPDDGSSLTQGMTLKDVSGTPNTIIGLSDGSFVDEIVAITKPAGTLGSGSYRIVMNQCQNGIYDPAGGDFVLGDGPNVGFIVQLPSALPPIPYSAIKTSAAEYGNGLSGISVDVPLLGQVNTPGFCSAYGKLTKDIPAASNLASWAQVALNACANLAAHEAGIAADPPDPNYKVFVELGNIGYASFPTSTPLERAASILAGALADQAVVVNALLLSTEKFQGAQQASDDEWTMLQLMQMNKYLNLYIGSGGAALRFYAALEAFDAALVQDALGATADGQSLHAFIPEIRETLGSLLTPLGLTFTYPFANNTRQVVPNGLQAFIDVYLGQDPGLLLVGLYGIPQERASEGLPPIVLPYPVASTGGNYLAPPNRTITFNASQSTDPNGLSLTYAWDLNGNGTFADGAGAQAQYSYTQPGTRIIAVKATDSAGNTNVAYGLVQIGDVSSQDMISVAGNANIYDIHPDGTYTQLVPGVGYADTLLKNLHVDVNGDIWVLSTNMLQHYNSNGTLLGTITPAQVGMLTSLSLGSFDDFVLDGRGDIIILAVEDLGVGYVNIAIGSTLYAQYPSDISGHTKVIRLAKDASRASFLADVHLPYYLYQTVSGVLYAWTDARDSCEGAPQAVSLDPKGNIVVGGIDANDLTRCGNGAWTVDPDTGAMTEVIPAGGRAYGGYYVTEAPYGTFTQTNLAFGGSSLFYGSWGAAPGEFVVDPYGNYLTSPGDDAGPAVRLGDTFIPPQITNSGPPYDLLNLQTFPVSTHTLGNPALILYGLTVNSAGDYVAVGFDYAGLLSGTLFTLTPAGIVTALPNTPASLLKVDVVPPMRTVTPKDMPAAPSLVLSKLSVSQNSCPGTPQLNVTVQNAGSAATPLPVRVYFYDGDPSGAGVVVGSAITAAPIPAGGSATLLAPWGNPAPGPHQIFALSVGAITVNTSYMVCVPAQFTTNPLLLSPASGTSSIGSPYTVSAQLRDALGSGISGTPIAFSVSGANTATGTVMTDGTGTAVFSYSGTNGGQDSIVATTAGITSNTVTNTWQGTSQSTTPPVVTPPANISIPATEAGGARGSASPALAGFLAGGSAVASVGSVTPLAPQVGGVSVNNSTLFAVGTTTVTFRFEDASGNIGTATATVTVSIGTPRITGSVAGHGTDPSGATYVNIVLTNTGTGDGRNLKVNSLTLRALSGTGTVTYDTALSPPLPITIGNLDVGATVTTQIFLNVPSTVARLSITENGTVQNVLGTNYSYSIAESMVP